MDLVKYVPVIKWKQGEKKAIKNLQYDIKNCITPLIEIPTIRWDFKLKKDSKTILEHLESIYKEFEIDGATPYNFYMDTHYLSNYKLDCGKSPILFLLEKLQPLNCNAIPVVYTKILFDNQTIHSLLNYVHESNIDICIRLKNEDIINPQQSLDLILNMLIKYSIDISKIHLIIDFGYINTNDYREVAKTYNESISKINKLELYKKVILASTSFPKDLNKFSINSNNYIDRVELFVWQEIKKRYPFIVFSDYCIGKPDSPDDLDQKYLSSSANIRYTLDHKFWILKGSGVKKDGYGQFIYLSKKIISSRDYYGKDYSYGDKFIYNCATNSKPSPGNFTTWRCNGVNHHITLVVNHLSSQL